MFIFITCTFNAETNTVKPALNHIICRYNALIAS